MVVLCCCGSFETDSHYLDQASLQLETHSRPPCLNFPSAEIINICDHSWFFSNFKIDTLDNVSKEKNERMNIYIHSRL